MKPKTPDPMTGEQMRKLEEMLPRLSEEERRLLLVLAQVLAGREK